MKIHEPSNQSAQDNAQFEAVAQLFNNDAMSVSDKIIAFPRYVSRQSMGKFLARYEIFKRVLNVHGSIVECGVLYGTGLFTWAKLSSLFEPANHLRKIIGFDTFSGFPSVSKKDTDTGTSRNLKEGGFGGNGIAAVKEAVSVYDMNRPLSHIEKIELIEGDIGKTAEEYIEKNPHLLVSLLHLNLDLYEPTKKALEVFVPRMPKGAIIVFDELDTRIFPGETIALLEYLNGRPMRIERFTFDSYTSFAVLE